MTSDLPVKIS